LPQGSIGQFFGVSDVTPMPSPASTLNEKRPANRLRRWRRALGLLILLAAAVVLIASFDVRAWIREALVWIERLGPWGQVLFVAIYIVATVLLIPGAALGLGAGAMFGVVRGSLLVSLASTLGATCAFLLGRHLAREWIAKKIEGNATFTAIDRAVADEGWKIVLLTRLSPLFPFVMLNYAFGITRVSLRDYVVASWIGMMPGTVLYVYLGSLARAGVADRQRTSGEWTLYAVGFLATLAVAVIATRIGRRTLAKRTSPVP
jgi:uncharacterized membrane protein YdjX (TVP38/TMEM64 family)